MATTSAPPPVKNDDKRVSIWRLPKDLSYSDWTIEVGSTGEEQHAEDSSAKDGKNHDAVQCFHVHRANIAAGVRKCRYFDQLFRTGTFVENEKRTSQIQLNKLSMEAFPAMLDYMYRVDQPLEITTDTAVALHFLAQYFDNPSLLEDATDFLNKDLSLTTGGTYIEHAVTFHDDKLVSRVIDFYAHRLHQVHLSSAIVKKGDLNTWMLIKNVMVKSSIATPNTNDTHVSTLVTEVVKRNRTQLSSEILFSLTEESFIPAVHYSVAADLLCLQESFLVDDVAAEEPGDEPRIKASSSLRTRCVDVLSTNWQELDALAAGDSMHHFSSTLLAHLLTKTVKNAKNEVSKLRCENIGLKAKVERSAKDEQLIRQLQEKLSGANELVRIQAMKDLRAKMLSLKPTTGKLMGTPARPFPLSPHR